MKKRKQKTTDPILLYLQGRHHVTCSYWTFSGDRHCSCGRDKALQRYKQLGFIVEEQPKKEPKMKVIVIGGYPGSGKSVIMRGVIASLEQKGQVFKVQSKGSVRYMSSKDYIILGTYEPDEKFPGTDRYPMNIQPAAQAFLLEANKMYPNKTVIFEGDRLFNDKMLKFLKDNEFETVICLVQTMRDLLEQRRNQRSEQNVSWRKGRENKVERMAIMYPISHYLANNTKEEQDQSIKTLVTEAEGTIAPVKRETKLKQLWK